VQNGITERIGDPNAAQPAPNSIIGRLRALELRTDAIGDPSAAPPAANTILGRLRTLEESQSERLALISSTIGDPNQPSATSVLGRLAAVSSQVNALATMTARIGTSDDPGPGTLQERLNRIEKQLGTIDTRLGAKFLSLSEKVDHVLTQLGNQKSAPS
jgi:hypothetical protein